MFKFDRQLTDYDLKELRDLGIFPHSQLATISVRLIVLTLWLSVFYSEIADLLSLDFQSQVSFLEWTNRAIKILMYLSLATVIAGTAANLFQSKGFFRLSLAAFDARRIIRKKIFNFYNVTLNFFIFSLRFVAALVLSLILIRELAPTVVSLSVSLSDSESLQKLLLRFSFETALFAALSFLAIIAIASIVLTRLLFRRKVDLLTS
ncbi:MAG TPA: EscU/YscU/HrcU family type III secretion system export apparatus switch protein [Oligoflexia bacterium]|nr:EscU/YscU/HrcU family type III secretion system export apparatus switch protein [Oligoflexia bacterium]HMP26645.1 EscU/YscU/HrcU family type III secretion system export apparatus switch protein [Oligoflexia bacterium]